MQVLQGCACLSSNAFLFVLVADKCSNNNLPDGVFRCRPSVLLVAIELDVTARKDLDVVIHASAPYRFSVIYTNHVSLVTLESRLWVESWLKFRCTPIALASPCNMFVVEIFGSEHHEIHNLIVYYLLKELIQLSSGPTLNTSFHLLGLCCQCSQHSFCSASPPKTWSLLEQRSVAESPACTDRSPHHHSQRFGFPTSESQLHCEGKLDCLWLSK